MMPVLLGTWIVSPFRYGWLSIQPTVVASNCCNRYATARVSWQKSPASSRTRLSHRDLENRDVIGSLTLPTSAARFASSVRAALVHALEIVLAKKRSPAV